MFRFRLQVVAMARKASERVESILSRTLVQIARNSHRLCMGSFKLTGIIGMRLEDPDLQTTSPWLTRIAIR